MAVSTLHAFAVPLRTLDPADRDASDLTVLRDVVADARVVALGESAHGVREFYQFKDRVLRYLVSELGFTAFVMESGFAEGLAVNDWVLGGAGNLRELSRTGINYGMGRCDEMRAQLQWMRDWNASHDRKVRFYGMDAPGHGCSPGPGIAASLARLERAPQDAELLTLAASLGEEQATILERAAAMSAGERERLTTGTADIVRRSRTNGNEIAHRCAVGADLVARAASFQPFDGQRSPRDQYMADNVRWILEREERIVIGAHNAHIQRWPMQAPSLSVPSLGQILSPVLGRTMVVIGTTYASGQVLDVVVPEEGASQSTISKVVFKELDPSPRTIDALMDGVDLPLHLVSLRRVPDAVLDDVSTMLINHAPHDVNVKTAFDALVHVRHVNPFDADAELRDGATEVR